MKQTIIAEQQIEILQKLIKQREEELAELESKITILKTQNDDLQFDLMKVSADRDYWKNKCK